MIIPLNPNEIVPNKIDHYLVLESILKDIGLTIGFDKDDIIITETIDCTPHVFHMYLGGRFVQATTEGFVSPARRGHFKFENMCLEVMFWEGKLLIKSSTSRDFWICSNLAKKVPHLLKLINDTERTWDNHGLIFDLADPNLNFKHIGQLILFLLLVMWEDGYDTNQKLIRGIKWFP
jgi:hypothetical protein